MHIQLSQNEQKLFDVLTTIPPSIEAASHLLASEKFTSDEVTRVAIEYSYQCFCEVDDFEAEHNIPRPKGIVQNLHSTYIVDVIALLLQHGLDPNGIHENCNIMESLHYVDNEFLCADALVLLLEHGGNYNLVVDGEELFSSTDFDVFFDAIEQYGREKYAAFVHYWMVMLGYGARCSEDKMQVFKEYDSSEYFRFEKLKNHRNYYFGITHLENDFAISIYDKDTLWEVARIK